jgi:multidrug efflux pump subunit AcrA (membrane-fusion protein)
MRKAALAALALLVGSLGCGGDPEAQGSSVTLPPVMVAPVEAHHVVEQIQAAGDLIAKEEATVSSEVGGVVTEILLDEGAAVAKGAVVIEIDPERRELELRSGQAGVERAEATSPPKRSATRPRPSSNARAPSWPRPGRSSVWQSARCATRASAPPSRL